MSREGGSAHAHNAQILDFSKQICTALVFPIELNAFLIGLLGIGNYHKRIALNAVCKGDPPDFLDNAVDR